MLLVLYINVCIAGQWYEDLLTSVINYCDLVDANALSILWPKEFDNYYFCFISGNLQHPVITTFKKNNKVPVEQLQEVIIHCDGSHFTLLRPRMSPQTNTPVRVKVSRGYFVSESDDNSVLTIDR